MLQCSEIGNTSTVCTHYTIFLWGMHWYVSATSGLYDSWYPEWDFLAPANIGLFIVVLRETSFPPFYLRRSRQVLLLLWGGAVCQSIDYSSSILRLHIFTLGWDRQTAVILPDFGYMIFFSGWDPSSTQVLSKCYFLRGGICRSPTQFIFRQGSSSSKSLFSSFHRRRSLNKVCSCFPQHGSLLARR